MQPYSENGEPKKYLEWLSRIGLQIKTYLPVTLLMSGFLSLAWTPELMQPSIMVEMDFIPQRPTIFHYIKHTLVFTLIFTGIAILISFIHLEIKRRVSSRFYVVGAIIGQFFGILLGIKQFSLGGFCGNTTPLELLTSQFFILLFWATVGFFLGLLVALLCEKSFCLFSK